MKEEYYNGFFISGFFVFFPAGLSVILLYFPGKAQKYYAAFIQPTILLVE